MQNSQRNYLHQMLKVIRTLNEIIQGLGPIQTISMYVDFKCEKHNDSLVNIMQILHAQSLMPCEYLSNKTSM